MLDFILQIETLDPEGYKLKWLLLIVVAFVVLYFLLRKAPALTSFIKTYELRFKVKKDKIYHSFILYFEIEEEQLSDFISNTV